MIRFSKHFKFLSFIIVFTGLFSNIVFASDYNEHWAKKNIERWVKKGVITGFPDGSFKPDNYITRAEFATLVKGLFNMNFLNDSKKYEDVNPNQWYTENINILSAHNIMNDYGDTFKPDQYITREEAAFAISNLYNINNGKYNDILFLDNDKISQWAKDSIYTLYNKGYINGRPDNNFNPQDNLTRAEMVTLIEGITSELLNVSGEYNYDNKELNNLIISTKDVKLEKANIKGNLYLTEGIKDGDVNLKDIKVNGNIYVNGGGINSIHIQGNSDINNIIVDKLEEAVRVVVENDSQVKKASIVSEANLEGKIIDIEITSGKKVNLKNVIADSVKSNTDISIEGGNLKDISINNEKAEVNIKNAKIDTVNINNQNANINILSSKVNNLKVLANDSKITTDTKSNIAKVDILKNVKSEINGNSVTYLLSYDTIKNYANHITNTSTTNTTQSTSSSSYSNNSNSSNSSSSNNNNDSSNNDNNNSDYIPPQPPITPPIVEDIYIERVELIENGKLKVTLNKATTNTLQLNAFSVYCPAFDDMTIISASTVEGKDKNKVYMVNTSYFKDNTYTLIITLDSGKKTQYTFISKYDCPNITQAYAVRDSGLDARFTFNSDELGTIYYKLFEGETVTNFSTVLDSVYMSKSVSRTIYTPTVDELKTTGIKAEMVATSNMINISELKENTSYSIFYVVEDIEGKRVSEVKGPVIIDAIAPELPPTSNITIENVKFISAGYDYKVEITLSQPTEFPLVLENFYVKCPADSEIEFTRIENNQNKIYTLVLEMGGFRDNYYDIRVTLPDNTIASGSYKCDLTAPRITSLNITRISQTQAKITFYSTERGTIYYGTILDDQYKPKVEEVKNVSKSTVLYAGDNTIILDNLGATDKIFYYFPIDEIGNEEVYVQSTFGDIPDDITQPPAESTMSIEQISVSANSMGTILKFTLNKETTYLSSADMSVSGGTSSTPPRIVSLTPGPSNVPSREFTINLNSILPTGTYKLTIKFSDGEVLKTFEVN